MPCRQKLAFGFCPLGFSFCLISSVFCLFLKNLLSFLKKKIFFLFHQQETDIWSSSPCSLLTYTRILVCLHCLCLFHLFNIVSPSNIPLGSSVSFNYFLTVHHLFLSSPFLFLPSVPLLSFHSVVLVLVVFSKFVCIALC